MGEWYNEYAIDLKIDTDKQYLHSKVKLDFYCGLPSTNVLKLYIYKDIEIDDITCDRALRYEVGEEIVHWNPFILESKLIELRFYEPILKGEKLEIWFNYKGYINVVTKYEINRLTKDWIELGMYTPWFPLYEDFREAFFKVNIDIDTGYKVINSKETEGHLVINQSIPQTDCTIIASKHFKHIKDKFWNISLNVYYIRDEHKGIAEQISSYLAEILNIYKRIGKIDFEEISVAIMPRKDGGGYCRPGLIVLTPRDDSTDKMGYFKIIAHELAHLWWNNIQNANTWEDWLNESFAEYSALMALRDVFGEEEFARWIGIYTQKTMNLPPIRDLDRGHEKAFEVLYMKGPLILKFLEEQIGRKQFQELLSEVYNNNIDTTDKLLDTLHGFTTQDVVANFHGLLLE